MYLSFVEPFDNVSYYTCDITQHDKVTMTMNEIKKQTNRIDVLVNAAGINKDKLLLQTKPDDIQQLLNVNILGTMYTCQAVLKTMMRQKQGSIINIGKFCLLSEKISYFYYSNFSITIVYLHIVLHVV